MFFLVKKGLEFFTKNLVSNVNSTKFLIFWLNFSTFFTPKKWKKKKKNKGKHLFAFKNITLKKN